VKIGWGFVITAVLFWAIHAFRVEGLSLSFYWQTLTMQLIAGLVFCWLRERTDSILPGIIAHNLANVIWAIV
jgi:membrane protease YdiL (CAAX protease family)